MTLLNDQFWSQCQSRLISTGWVITEGSRYDPTHLEGFTPTGRTFTLDCVDNVVTLVIAGRTRTVNLTKDAWEEGSKTVDAILTVWNNFPANQK